MTARPSLTSPLRPVKAIDRFDLGRGLPFAGFAVPTVIGEIRRHFRDTTWEVRVPRRVQELYRDLAETTEDLTVELRHMPSTAQLAAVDSRMRLRQRLAELSPRDRRIIALRFDDELTQTQIATEPGMSQMHISRLLTRSLDQLRQAA
ncbi:hypothetical protein Cme02nite_30540 [Catellatospora methionotrophica]|uniref:RNA polymerase sigma-70 region 4 domain-containing protein n=1 Tax=Catellatospora methionotrophica TaxID=121620 RepID=A0A8J3L985_9ACTN|nr:sigma-70 family RNA polymerase sigma factor [Catellatospora methionotrophica]GIG14722.1 hypothetical protein Cme02nite_30540 [Catellatospora methionotrophica]